MPCERNCVIEYLHCGQHCCTMGHSFPLFLVNNYGWGCDLLYQKPLGLTLVAGPNAVVFGWQVRPKTLPKHANNVESCIPAKPNRVFDCEHIMFDCGRHCSACGGGVVFSVCKSERLAGSLQQDLIALGPASTRT